ncbi:hypothetical protein PG985_011414 [Apiospora marii]|uniref:Transcription factor domain-containing protein n=1 Tax=Apiospora marii TaxID=335849 RepID=A0ABR1STP0_9PEZI
MHPGQSGPVEAVFSIGSGVFPDGASGSKTTLFHYAEGPVKVPGPWKRGRPRGGGKKATRKAPAGFQFVNLAPGKTSAVVRKELNQPSPKTGKKSQNPPGPSGFQAPQEGTPDFQRLVGHLNLYQIQGVDPFGQAPIPLEPYMLDFLRYSFQHRGLRHLQDAISVVKRRLSIPDATFSSTTLAVIAGIAMLEKGAGNHENWAIHMQGLRDLVDHRGGRQALASEPLVLHKIYRYLPLNRFAHTGSTNAAFYSHSADLFGCLDTGQRAWFSGPSLLSFRVQPTAPVRSEGFTALFETIDICPPLRNCVRELESSVAFWFAPGTCQGDNGLPDSSNAILKPVTKPTPAQAKHVRDLLTEVQYALVSDEVLQHCNQDTDYGRINNFCRIVIIIYSLTILHEPTPTYTLGRQIGVAFSRAYSNVIYEWTVSCPPSPSRHQQIPVDFRLWALFLAATAMEGTECDTSRHFRAMFSQLAIDEYGKSLFEDGHAALKARLEQYLWIPYIHNAAFERTWEKSFRAADFGAI